MGRAACLCDPVARSQVRQHRCDSLGGSTFERVDHQEQFDEVRIDRRARRLDDEDVGAANVLQDLKIDFTVAEPCN